MNKIKTALVSLTLMASAILPASNAFAANAEIINLVATNNGSTIHVEGRTNALAVAIEVMNNTGEVSVAGPETTSVVDNGFSYDFTGTFNTSTVYNVRVADYDAGTWYTIQTTTIEPDTPSDGGQGSTDAKQPNTGIAPKRSETADRATANISLGLSVIISSALAYAFYLLNKRKA
ncbi:hypothetical protein J6W91_00160 [Candidatus Saccharibacteria bacterium]|nr:hypothetical protein [Candidatus Saccharibacteria bacterium]